MNYHRSRKIHLIAR